MSDLKTVHVTDGIFVPRGLISKDDVVYDSEGRLVAASCLSGIPGSGPAALLLDPSEAPRRLPKSMMSCNRSDETSVVFLGMFDILHYGHWLSDGLSRFWYLLDNPLSNRFVMSWNIKRRIKHIRDLSLSLGFPYWPAALAAFDIKERQFCRVNKPTRFAEIIVPYPSQNLNVRCPPDMIYIHPCHLQVTRKIAESITSGLKDTKGSQIVYVSRSRLKIGRAGAIMNEIPVEDFCRSKGVEIIHPQLLTLAEKIEVISEANMIIGRPGTSFLNLMFRRNSAPARCIYLGSSQDQLMVEIEKRFPKFDVALGNKYSFIDCLRRLDGDPSKTLVCDVDKAIAGLKQVLG
jgi:hypothetical protein